MAPNMHISYDVDAFGQTWRQVSPRQRANARASLMAFDKLGRMTERQEPGWTGVPGLTSSWTFDTAPGKGKGQLHQAQSDNGYSRVHQYDGLGRPLATTQTLTDGSYTSRTEYDDWGRVRLETLQRGTDAAKAYRRHYNAWGYLRAVSRAGQQLWAAQQQDAAQRVRQALLGNGLSVNRSYNPASGRLEGGNLRTNALAPAQPETRLQESYTYDDIGSVKQRNHYWDATGFSEAFTYDALNRLDTSQVTGQPLQTFGYDAAGNMRSKTGVGSYSYPVQGPGAVRPHAVTAVSGLAGSFTYDDNGNLISAPGGRTQEWTVFDMPAKLQKGASVSTYAYGPEHQRVLMRRENAAHYTVYAGGQEVEVKASGERVVKTYWPMGLGVEIDTLPSSGGAPTSKDYWIHADHLGSPVALTDAAGKLAEQLAFDAWGKRRTLLGDATPDALDGVVDNKGFTRHEMLDHLDLVHMNGRVYDPFTAKFMSGDPLIQDPMNGQGYSRYSYVWNNPTNLTDPTGFCAEGKESGAGTRICGGIGANADGATYAAFQQRIERADRSSFGARLWNSQPHRLGNQSKSQERTGATDGGGWAKGFERGCHNEFEKQ